jgi:HD-GYP domain-containing protein (c-di-GMP phosphodiesterase class II)
MGLRMVSVRNLESGHILAKPILGSEGRILLQKGVVLTSGYIRRLQSMNCNYVYIQDSETYDIDIQETVSLEVQQEVISKIKNVYDRMSDPKRNEKLVNSGQLGREFTDLFKLLFESLMSDRSFIVNLTAIYSSDAYLYTHCMNVGTMASVLGMAAGFNQERIFKFGLGAMIHDIGKLKINQDILNKPGKLTEEERVEVERHCELGYQMMVKQPDISTLSAHCALQHHEKFDGTGYPRKLRGKDIHEFGRILAVPDVYDALTSNRVYRKAMLPKEAVEYLYAQAGSHFDPQYVRLFLKHINIYPNGTPVHLSNNLEGVVARPNTHNLQRPVVLVLSASRHKVTPYELDLAKELDVTIVGCNTSELGLV